MQTSPRPHDALASHSTGVHVNLAPHVSPAAHTSHAFPPVPQFTLDTPGSQALPFQQPMQHASPCHDPFMPSRKQMVHSGNVPASSATATASSHGGAAETHAPTSAHPARLNLKSIPMRQK